MDADTQAYLNSRYQKIKLLRKTDKGEVWLASTHGGKPVILKKINFVGLPYAALKENPNPLWAKIFFCLEDDGETFVAEEFIGGESLSDRLDEKNFLSEREAHEIILQLCDGLKVLHGLGIIHRDIKPSNLILQNGKIRLIDFDAARNFKPNKNEDTNFLGTRGYAPPEQYGYGQTDPRSDIYSLGVTMKKLLGENYSGRLKKILEKCTEVDPKNRFQSVGELENSLREKKPRIFWKIFGIFILAAAGIFLFRGDEEEEKISAPTIREEKNSAEEKVSEKARRKEIEVREEKSFVFPEIVFPSTEKIFDSPAPTPQKNFEIPSPEKNSAPQVEVPRKNYVRVKYFLNGERVNGWTDNFEQDIYNAGNQTVIKNLDGFQKLGGGAVMFPSWTIGVEVENLTDHAFLNPQLEIFYNDDGRTEKKILTGATIPSGGKINFSVPLNQFRVTNPGAAGESFLSLHNFKINFSGSGAEIHGSAIFFDFVFQL